jgi:hypothetical protein
MNLLKRCYIGLLVVVLALNLRAQPVLIHPLDQSFGSTGFSNLRVRSQSADGTEAVLTVDFSYDGFSGPSARILPVITDKKQPKVSHWFGANPVSISSGRGTISIRVKFFNDEPGVPAELTTDHVNILLLTDGGNVKISEGRFAQAIKWGNPKAQPAKVQAVETPVETPNQAQAQAEEKSRIEAEAKQLADLQAEAKRIADERARQEAEAKLLADQQAEAKRIADEKARHDAEAKRLADQHAEAKRIADERARQEAEAKLLADQQAEAKRIADEKSRQEAEAKRLADQHAEAKRIADEKAREEAEAKLLADQQAEARRIADEKSRQEAEAKRLTEENLKAVAPTIQPAPAKGPFALSSTTKTKVTNVDVVNRNMDRTEMTIAVEYQYAKEDGLPRMGIDIASTEEPGASAFFTSPVVDLGRGNRNFVMFPVKLDAAAAQSFKRATLPTDKVWVYLADANGVKSYIYQSTMVLAWHLPGASAPAPVAVAPKKMNTVEIDSFKQNDLFSGYVTVRYNLAVGSTAKLRLKVYDSAKPATADWFACDDLDIKSGPGLQLIRIAVPKEAPSPDVFNADTVEVQMLDKKGTVTVNVKKETPMSWAKPK